MSTDASPNTTEWHWIRRVAEQLEACAARAGEIAVVLCETRSRRVTVETARLALAYLGAQVAVVEVPTPANPGPVPIRSTGASVALQGHAGAVAACAAAGIVVDCTVEGLLHSPELGTILAGGARVLMISNEHPEVFERLAHDPSLAGRVDAGLALMQAAEAMRVTSPHGTDLTVNLDGALRAGSCGWTTEPGTIAHWPGGLVLCFPAAGCVAGTIVLAPGDVNLTFKEYVRTPVRLTIADDHITAVEGDGLDAELFASYLAAWGDRAAYAVNNPRPVDGLRRAQAARTFYFDPTFTLQSNVVDGTGAVLFPAGTRKNPLEVVSLSKHLLFFDARDPGQVARARELIEHYQGKVKPILVGGSYLDLMKRWNKPVFYDQDGTLVRKFGIAAVPAIVSQEGQRLRIDEVPVR